MFFKNLLKHSFYFFQESFWVSSVFMIWSHKVGINIFKLYISLKLVLYHSCSLDLFLDIDQIFITDVQRYLLFCLQMTRTIKIWEAHMKILALVFSNNNVLCKRINWNKTSVNIFIYFKTPLFPLITSSALGCGRGVCCSELTDVHHLNSILACKCVQTACGRCLSWVQER